ncbi:MAG: hypothetical protein ACXVCP_09955 [Bdellovibrio sp.]
MTELELADLGKSLRRINSNLLKKQINCESIWYQGDERYFDIFINCDGEDILWFQVTLRGKFVEWKKGQEFKSGNTNELEIDLKSPASKLMSKNGLFDLEFSETVSSILEYCFADPVLAKVNNILKSRISQK